MPPTLRDEIKQPRPFQSMAEEAAVNLVRTANVLNDQADLLFREHGVTAAQYNVLRILRGAGPGGIGRNDIRERLLTRMPDVTRLLDRMEEAGLVRRERDTADRRCVPTYLTEQGQALVDALDEPVAVLHRRHFGQLSDDQLGTLIDLLTLVRHP